MQYWQVGAGYGGESGGGRNYSDVFLDYGVMLIGPGEYGDYRDNVHSYDQEREGREVIRFVEEVKVGDVVALKRPYGRQWEVLAVGVVKSAYEWLPVFDDVEGWDIQHGRRIDWVKPSGDKRLVNGLTQGRFKRVENKRAKQEVTHILESGEKVRSCNLPSPAQMLSDQDVVANLMDHGMRAREAEGFTQSVQRIRDLAEWYRNLVRKGIKVKEHETRTFLIVPLLLALGWPEKKLKIEWHNVDIAFFDNPYNEDTDQCVMVLESKKLLESLASRTINQAYGYANKYPRCSQAIVSDGCSYKLFERKGGDDWYYSAYLNVLKPRLSHPYRDGIGGASEVLVRLLAR